MWSLHLVHLSLYPIKPARFTIHRQSDSDFTTSTCLLLWQYQHQYIYLHRAVLIWTSKSSIQNIPHLVHNWECKFAWHGPWTNAPPCPLCGWSQLQCWYPPNKAATSKYTLSSLRECHSYPSPRMYIIPGLRISLCTIVEPQRMVQAPERPQDQAISPLHLNYQWKLSIWKHCSDQRCVHKPAQDDPQTAVWFYDFKYQWSVDKCLHLRSQGALNLRYQSIHLSPVHSAWFWLIPPLHESNLSNSTCSLWLNWRTW